MFTTPQSNFTVNICVVLLINFDKEYIPSLYKSNIEKLFLSIKIKAVVGVACVKSCSKVQPSFFLFMLSSYILYIAAFRSKPALFYHEELEVG